MSILRQNQFSDHPAAHQKTGGVVAGTALMTMDGALPVEYLMPGDRIITRSGARVLVSISVRLEQDAAMVRIGAGILGRERPSVDTLVPLHQMILIRDWRAQALYGAPQALVAAGRLADGQMIRVETMAEARVFTLEFAEDVVIYAAGLEIACLREPVSV